jgi:hypothetical protein
MAAVFTHTDGLWNRKKTEGIKTADYAKGHKTKNGARFAATTIHSQ